jgi:outer membrane protein assembly factor BamE
MRPISTRGNGFTKTGTRRILRTPAVRWTLAVGLAVLSSGCVYRMSITQGNFLEGKSVDQLQVGMTRAQVRYLLGTPMVPDAFDKERWDYLYYFKRGRLKTPEQRHLIVFFQEDKVTKFDRFNIQQKAPAGVFAPAQQQPEQPEQEKDAPIAKFPKL